MVVDVADDPYRRPARGEQELEARRFPLTVGALAENAEGERILEDPLAGVVDVFAVAGCRFEVQRREFWPASRRMGSLYSVSGPPRIVLVACKADDYSKRTVIFARKL